MKQAASPRTPGLLDPGLLGPRPAGQYGGPVFGPSQCGGPVFGSSGSKTWTQCCEQPVALAATLLWSLTLET